MEAWKGAENAEAKFAVLFELLSKGNKGHDQKFEHKLEFIDTTQM